MKKILLLAAMVGTFASNGQIFSEDFESGIPNTPLHLLTMMDLLQLET